MSRPTTSACDQIPSGYNDFRQGVDVFGYNYKPEEYLKFRAAHPAQPDLAERCRQLADEVERLRALLRQHGIDPQDEPA